jgi:hypothetical protein
VRKKSSRLCFSTWPISIEVRGNSKALAELSPGARSFAAFCVGLSVIVAMINQDGEAAVAAALGHRGFAPKTPREE